MDYTSTLETLEDFWMTLARDCANHIGALEILYGLVKVIESQKLVMLVNKAPSSLYFDS